MEGPINLFQVSNGTCLDFSVISVLRLFCLCDGIYKFVRLLVKSHILARQRGEGVEEICLKVRTQLKVQIASHILIIHSGGYNIPTYKGAIMGHGCRMSHCKSLINSLLSFNYLISYDT